MPVICRNPQLTAAMPGTTKQHTKTAIFNLLSKQEGDSFELGRYYFSSLPPAEKEEIRRLLNKTSLHYFYMVNENGIERVAL
jgi:hypothetical protein